MTGDLLIVVPPGTRVRYIESGHVDRPVAIDASKLDALKEFTLRQPFSIRPPIPPFFGIPIYDAEQYEEGQP